MAKTHGIDHWSPETCFGCRIRTVAVSATAMPSRGGNRHVANSEQMERNWSKDHAAYRRMKKEGLEPKVLDGADHLEAVAKTPAQIEGKEPIQQ